MALGTWITCKVLFSDKWLYDHITLICSVAGIAIALVVIGIMVMWKHTAMTTVVVAATLATTAQAGIFTPAGGDSANSGKTGSYWSWLLHGWDFGWGFWRDGLDSWQSGHPVVNIDPAPPSNSDTSGK